MYIIEESKLLEDTIEDNEVRNLYKLLSSYETNGELSDLLHIVQSQGIGPDLVDVIVDLCNIKGIPIHKSSDTRLILDDVERVSTCEKLNLSQHDLAALALIMSATLLELFVAENFINSIGIEELHANQFGRLPEVFQRLKKEIDCSTLTIDSCEVHHKIASPWLLRGAHLCSNFLKAASSPRKSLELEFSVWRHRLLTIHLTLVLEPPESILNELRKIQEYIFDHHILGSGDGNKTQLLRFNEVGLCCELIQSALIRGSLSFCRKFFNYATELSGISIEHEGVLGRRTKFQQEDIPQLVVKVSQSLTDFKLSSPSSKSSSPVDVKLDDDTLLPDIKFAKNDETAMDQLSIEAQVLMLSALEITMRNEAMEESLKDEYILAYLRTILNCSSVFALKHKCLALRSHVEKRYSRRMDRALRQMEALTQDSELQTDELRQINRREWFYSVIPFSIWQVQRSLGDISFDMGLFKNALEIYSKVEFWEGMIKCYSNLNQAVKAESIIRQELEKNKTPYLYCLLGDVTDDVDHYEESWKLSNGRFARAKKSLGTYYYVRKDFSQAIEHYVLAFKCSPSNVSILSLLAYCHLILENFHQAAEYYRNLTYLDDGNFLAWNNLSKAYIALGQMERAWRTLREAIKCNYEEWKVWDNFMIVSMEIDALDDVILAWHRLIDIKSSHKNDKILKNLTFSLLNRYNESDPSFEKILSEALKLVARLISTSDCSPRVWICYFKLQVGDYRIVTHKEDPKVDSKFLREARIKKLTNTLQRATPLSPIIDSYWIQKPDEIIKVLGYYEELIDCYSFALDIIGPNKELNQRWKYFKLTVNTTIKTLENKGYT